MPYRERLWGLNVPQCVHRVTTTAIWEACADKYVWRTSQSCRHTAAPLVEETHNVCLQPNSRKQTVSCMEFESRAVYTLCPTELTWIGNNYEVTYRLYDVLCPNCSSYKLQTRLWCAVTNTVSGNEEFCGLFQIPELTSSNIKNYKQWRSHISLSVYLWNAEQFSIVFWISGLR